MNSSSNTSLKVKNVSCKYGDKEILDKVSLSIGSQDFVGIIGPNASGKTTLLRTINRIIEPSHGAILLDDRDIKSISRKELAKRMATVPQDFSPRYPFKARRMVIYGRTPHLGPLEIEGEKDLAIVMKAMERTNTADLAERPITELSGGEKRRILIAKALAQEPSVLLLDEPTDHLDINHQLEILDMLKKLIKEEKVKMIATFHDLNLAARYCDPLILLYRKRIFAKGHPEDVLTEENLREVYGTDVSLKRNPETNSISVIPLPAKEKEEYPKPAIHLICGGGTGKLLMHALHRKGYKITAGTLTRLDDDYREARKLKIKVAEEEPFSPISPGTEKENQKLVESSDLVILTDMPIGRGNLKNLETAVQAANDKPVVFFARTPIEKLNFVGGEVLQCFHKLKKRGATKISSQTELFTFLKSLKGGLD